MTMSVALFMETSTMMRLLSFLRAKKIGSYALVIRQVTKSSEFKTIKSIKTKLKESKIS